MTKSIDEQIEEAANECCKTITCAEYQSRCVRGDLFKEGAKFGRELERNRILELLRSEEAIHSGINRDGKVEQTLEAKPVGPWIMSAKLWADWLEEKLK